MGGCEKREHSGQPLSRPTSRGTPWALPETSVLNTGDIQRSLWPNSNPLHWETHPTVGFSKPSMRWAFFVFCFLLFLCQGATGSEDTGRVTSSKFKNWCIGRCHLPPVNLHEPASLDCRLRDPAVTAQWWGFMGPGRGMSRAGYL